MTLNRLLIAALLLFPISAWWDADWNYSRPLTPDKNASLIVGWATLDTKSLISSGKMRHDCGDIRVVEEDAEVGHRVVGCNTSFTNIFFNVDHSLKDFEIYYGNPAAAKASSSGFFTFHDDFESYPTGSPGGPTWTIRSGGFSVNYSDNSQRFMVNASQESIATAHNPSGNFSVFAEVKDPHPESGNPGVTYGYVNSTHAFAAYVNGSEVWVRENTSSRKLADFTNYSFNYVLVEVVDQVAYVYVNGNQAGTGDYSAGSVGTYANSTAVNATIDEFAVFPREGVSWSIGSETNRPELVLKFVGSEGGNMRTVVSYLGEGERVMRITLETQTSKDLIVGNVANLSWADISFNSTGYSVNETFVQIEGDYFNYTQGKYRFDLSYVKTGGGYRRWHVVQFFKNFPAVKHIVFLTANQTGTHPVEIYPWASCSSYISTNGSSSCTSSMHSPSGEFAFGGASICGLHNGSTGPFKVAEDVPMTNKEFRKEIFWQSYIGCGNFTEEVEHLCGTEFFNCTATAYSPVKTLFYVNNEPHVLARAEYPSGFNCKINQNPVLDLVDSSIINKGLNDLECSGSGDLSYFRLYSSPPYEATRFFGEKPEVYEVTLTGPIDRAKILICGIPVLNKIMPFKCSGSSMFFENSFGNGTYSFHVFKTNRSWNYTQASGGQLINAEITRTEPQQLPMAAAKDMGNPETPPTHEVINSRRLFYSNGTVLEVVITAWQTV